ncbi:MAG TPA: toll/interleukin-1 receptor domain-containing protein [Verrucomicrobiae bacterium]
MKVFISNSEADEKWARLLRSRLSEEGFEVWNSANDIAPGDNWLLKSGKALQNADAMIVLLSPDSAKSDWVRSEIEYALSSSQFRSRVIPLLIKPTEDVPWILHKLHFIRATKDMDETVNRVVATLQKLPVAA